MTNREKEIFNMIKENPLITQKEIADVLGLQRSSVAVHILNLTKKGLIKGKGYILSEGEYVVVIGGSNIDILGTPNDKPTYKDSNPGKINTSLGGVGRNIAENMSNLDLNTKLISVVGKDDGGQRIIEQGKKSKIDMDFVSIIDGGTTSTYLSVLDEGGDMLIALSDMDIVNRMDVSFIKNYESLIRNASLVVLDTNLPKETIDYLLSRFEEVTFFVDTVSTTKTVKIVDHLDKINCIKPNRHEAEILAEQVIEREEDFYSAVETLLEKGIERVFITAGENGVYYGDADGMGHFKAEAEEIVNANGAGDVFMASLVYCYLNNLSVDYSARFSTSASILTMMHIDTINSELSVEKIEEEMNQFEREL